MRILGVSDVVADDLPRMWYPEPKPMPSALASCPRPVVTVRARAFHRMRLSRNAVRAEALA